MSDDLRLLLVAAWAVFRKDLRVELRNRYALNAIVLFAVCSVVALSLGLGPLAPLRNPDLPLIHAGLLWITLLFAAFSGLARAFVYEEETRTAPALRLAARPTAIYLGKLLFNLLLLLLLMAITAPLAIVLLRISVENPALLLALLLAGSLALVAATTLIAAIIARADGRGALFAVLSFPLLIPVLVAAIRGTAQAFAGQAGDAIFAPLQVLASYAVALITASLFLFPLVWE